MRYGIAESRLLKKFMEEMKSYGNELNDRYLSAWKEKDNLKKVTGTALAGLSAALEGPDRAWGALMGQNLKTPNGILGRTRRDAGELLKNVVTLHPLRAMGDAWRLVTSSPILDTADAFGGHIKH